VHGGAFIGGSAALYDGAQLASHGAVVVTFNYRLGVLGFLSSSALPAGSLNLGLQDQRAALRWVASNAAAFGGDPTRVTLCGESAGAHSVSAHLLSPASQGLFQRAIMQSGSISWFPALPLGVGEVQSLATAQRSSASFMSFLACTNVSCARAVSAETVLNTQLGLAAIGTTFQLVLDGADLPVDPTAAFLANGSASSVEVLAGWNREEGTVLLYDLASSFPLIWHYGPWAQELVGLRFLASTIFGTRAGGALAQAAALRLYDPALYNASTSNATQALIRDYFFACPTDTMLTGLAEARPATNVYAYTFTHKPSWFNCVTNTTADLCDIGIHMGAMHGGELPYLFAGASAAPFTAEETAMSNAMQAAWVSFAATGLPRADWPPWNVTSKAGMRWEAGVGWPAEVTLNSDCSLFSPPGFVVPATSGAARAVAFLALMLLYVAVSIEALEV